MAVQIDCITGGFIPVLSRLNWSSIRMESLARTPLHASDANECRPECSVLCTADVAEKHDSDLFGSRSMWSFEMVSLAEGSSFRRTRERIVIMRNQKRFPCMSVFDCDSSQPEDPIDRKSSLSCMHADSHAGESARQWVCFRGELPLSLKDKTQLPPSSLAPAGTLLPD